MLSSEKKHDENSFHVHYMQMQRDSMESLNSLYSLSSGSLPSHFRSVCPKVEVRFSIEAEDQKPPSRCSTKTVYIILAAIFIVSSSIAVAVAVHEIRRIQEESTELPSYQFLNSTGNEKTTASDIVTSDEAEQPVATPPQRPSVSDPRTRCFKRCTVYGKPKFESRCVAGFCVCNGKDFQENTCLPSINGCVISKELLSHSTFIWNTPTTAFRCTRNEVNARANTAEDIYVIGINGNHFSESTIVNVSSEDHVTKPITVVLASHYPIRWKVKNRGLPIKEIVLVSDGKLSASQLEMINGETVPCEISPQVRKVYLPVGYGDDRYHSNTSEMLKKINNIIGPVKSFLGASYADTIYLKIAS